MKSNQSCSSSSTWAGESNSFARWAGASSWVWSSTVQESRLMASTLELFGPHWSLHFSIERPLEDWRSPTAKLPTDHLCILLVKVSFTHWGPRLLRLHLQSAWTQTSPIHQPDRVWREREPALVLEDLPATFIPIKLFLNLKVTPDKEREHIHTLTQVFIYRTYFKLFVGLENVLFRHHLVVAWRMTLWWTATHDTRK